ncbi:ABC transporter substrate-binding protein [Magnetovirga frankeli]|uniref:ABC transporter substrate-binding protein n=1 Tax=Magnetovirga frankeli TaxID=947516 RepID=UPI003D346021
MSDAENPIRLGLMPPLSGLVQIYGQEISWAARIAVDQINRAGGLLGRPLQLIIEDDGSLPETAVPAAKRLVDEHGCSAIIGNLLSNSRIAVASEVAEVRQIPYLNFSFYEGSIAGRYFFHFAALPNQQIERMIPYMADKFGPKFYFAGNNYEWPRGSIDAAKRALLPLGGEVVGEQYLPIGTSLDEINWMLDGVARSGADVFVPYFAGIDQINLLNRFTEMGLKQRMAVVMGHYDEVMVSHLSEQVREGLYSSNTYFMSIDSAENRAYLRQLAQLPEVNGIWPEGNGVLTNFGEGTYVCVQAFAEAVRQSGSLDAEALVQALERIEIQAPQGRVRMDPLTHHAEVNSYLSRCTAAGQFEIIQRFGSLAPEIPPLYRDAFRRAFFSSGSDSPEAAALFATEAAINQQRGGEAGKILSIADVAVIATDADGQITEVNSGACELFGYSESELVGLSVNQLLPPQFRARHSEMMRHFLEGPETQRRMNQRAEISGYRKDGSYFPMEASIAKFRGENGWVLVATIRDLTQVKEAQEELAWQASHDVLTGLPNRALIMERLQHALERGRRRDTNVALLFIDLDGFKQVNDSYGHEAGDVLLTTLAERLMQSLRPGDTLGRLAGDEFVALCEGIEEADQVAQIAQRLSEASRRVVHYRQAELSVSASIGIAVGHATTHTADDLLRHADTAMYAVKQKGRDGWQFFSQAVQQETSQRLEIAAGLRRALEQGEFQVVLQPIVGSDSGSIRGAEMLLRWHSPKGPISPALFIPVAETSNIIIGIGRWVFEQACLAERRLRQRFGAFSPYITVNLSTRQMLDEELVESFQAILKRTGARPQNLVLEITETSLMADVGSNRVMLERFTDMGLRLAVDDFGTGYSSLAQLLNLRAHSLKIDRAFIDQLEHSQENQAVVAAISRMGRGLKMQLVAEGVETEAQRNLVRAYGIHYIQGYYFHRPMSEADLSQLLAEREHSLEPDEEPLRFILYISRPSPDLDTLAFQGIADHAVQANRKLGVTGYMILLDGACMQYLEGQGSKVQELYRRIAADHRHSEVRLLAEGSIQERLFMDWSMGFRRLGDSQLSATARLQAQQDPARGVFEWYRDNPSVCCSLFEAIGGHCH